MKTDAPSFDSVLRRDLSRLDDEDVRLFLAYFDDLKRHVRKYLGRKARRFPGDSAVAETRKTLFHSNGSRVGGWQRRRRNSDGTWGRQNDAFEE